MSPESDTSGKEVDESASKGDPTRLTRDELLDFLVENLEEVHEFVDQRKREKGKRKLEASDNPVGRRARSDEVKDRAEKHPRRQEREGNLDHTLTAKMIQDYVQQQMQKAIDGVLGREAELDLDFSPFTKEITEGLLPSGFKAMPQLESYDGLGDPHDHLYHCVTMLKAHRFTKENMCTMIPTTFRHAARKWYNDLKPNSISSFEDFRQKFLTHFMGSKSIRKPPSHLMMVQQKKNESLQEYVRRFNKEANDVYGSNDIILLTAFVNGVKPGHFNRSLTEDYPKDFLEALRRAGKAIQAEESDRSKQETYGFGRFKKQLEQASGEAKDEELTSTMGRFDSVSDAEEEMPTSPSGRSGSQES